MERIKIENHISVIKGLISYHERMVLPIKGLECQENRECPAVRFENDLYLDTLKAALVLFERQLAELGG